MGMLDDIAASVGELGTAICDGAVEVMNEAEKALNEVEKEGDRIFGTASEGGSENRAGAREGSSVRSMSERREKYQSIMDRSGSLLESVRKLEEISGDDLGSSDLEGIRSELRGHSPSDRELDELMDHDADELLSVTQEMVDGMSGLLSGFKEISHDIFPECSSSADEAGSQKSAAAGKVSIYVSAAGKSAAELSKLTLYTWDDSSVRGTTALRGSEDGWSFSGITPERAEDGLAVFRLDIVSKKQPFSFIVRTEGNAAQTADLRAEASAEPVLVTWDAASSGQGTASQLP